MTRAEHLAWCKARALAYLDRGDLDNAFVSMCSDLEKHEETSDHAGIRIGLLQQLGGYLATPERMRAWIVGFH